jgi:hypothetical protein
MSRPLCVINVIPLDVGHLRLTWDDGVTREVDVSAWLTHHPLLQMLNVPEVFRDVGLVEGGSGIAWANGADFCADALRLLSDEQVKMQPRVNA